MTARFTQTGRRSFLARSAAAAAAMLPASRWLYPAEPPGVLRMWLTSEKQRHEAVAPVPFAPRAGQSRDADTIVVDAGTQYQPVLGFGAALTDASCWLLSRMEPAARQTFLRDTYGEAGMALNLGRVAIGSSDYSRSVYSYDDVAGDTSLSHFSLDHDEAYILPVLREMRAANPRLFLLASPWSPPGWMKTYGSMLGGWMSAPFLEPYAQYFLRFIRGYAKAGVSIDAVTSQNELETDQGGSMPATYWTPDMEADFIRDHLGPLFRREKLDTQIWLLDHNYNLWKRVHWQLRDASLRSFVSGVAWHGYLGTPDMMSRLHDADPNVPFFWTEGGPDITDPKYAVDWTRWGGILTEAMRNWCRAIITWNLMLDANGEPNIGPFRCGGLVTLQADGSIKRSGQFWALRHFSQHVRREAVRIASRSEASELMHIGFRNPDRGTVLVITNTGEARSVRVHEHGQEVEAELPANSIATLVW